MGLALCLLFIVGLPATAIYIVVNQEELRAKYGPKEES